MVALLPYPHITTSWPAPGNFLLAGTIEGSYPPATMDGSTGWGFDDAFLVELEASPSGAPKIRCENWWKLWKMMGRCKLYNGWSWDNNKKQEETTTVYQAIPNLIVLVCTPTWYDYSFCGTGRQWKFNRRSVADRKKISLLRVIPSITCVWRVFASWSAIYSYYFYLFLTFYIILPGFTRHFVWHHLWNTCWHFIWLSISQFTWHIFWHRHVLWHFVTFVGYFLWQTFWHPIRSSRISAEILRGASWRSRDI